MKMRAVLLAAVVALLTGHSSFSAALAADRDEVQALSQTIHEADREGNFERAARAAEQCMTATASAKAGAAGFPANYFCMSYLSSALKNGRGVPRDEGRAFAMLRDLAEVDRDGDDALTLAEDYLDGAGTPRNPIEAAVILWRVQHGAFSIYSDYWGMCMDCDGLWRHEKAVVRRIGQELTKSERTRADAMAASRFPDVTAHAEYRDRQITAGTAFPVVVLGGLFWRRWARRRHPSPAET